MARTIKTGRLFRSAEVKGCAFDDEKRTIELSFSSEEPYERMFGIEVLGHNPEEVKLNRLNNGGALLMDHNTRDQVGVVERAWVDAGRGRAVVRFSKSARGQEIWQDVKDGIRSLVSVGYEVSEMASMGKAGGMESFRVTDWTPMEISLVACPADPTVGVGRSVDGEEKEVLIREAQPTETKGTVIMAEENKTPTIDQSAIEQAATKAERNRISGISALAAKASSLVPDADALAAEAIKNGLEVNDFQKQLWEKVPQQTPTRASNPEIGMKERDLKRYSLQKAINEASENKLSGLEREVSDEAFKRGAEYRTQPCSFTIPQDVLNKGWMQRDSLVATSTLGGFLVGTELQPQNFIDALRVRVTAMRLGARTITGLVGNVNIPRLNTSVTINWTGEVVSSTEANIHLGMVTLSPKCATVFVDYSKMLTVQSTPDIEGMLRSDITQQIAAKLDHAVYHGVSTGPVGLETYTGVNAVTIGANGGAMTWAKILEMEQAVATANGDISSQAFVTNPKVRASLKAVLRNATGTDATFIWRDDNTVNGYPVAVSTNIASNLTTGTSTTVCSALFFGSFDQVLLGFWGGLDLLVDPYSAGATRVIRVYASQYCDANFRQPAAFARCLELTT